MDPMPIIDEEVFKKLDISKYDLFEYDSDYNKFYLKDFAKIVQIIKKKIEEK